MDAEKRGTERQPRQEKVPLQPCPVCGFPMVAVRGSRDAVCGNCGFKDSCCY